jgi:hypothetical protein
MLGKVLEINKNNITIKIYDLEKIEVGNLLECRNISKSRTAEQNALYWVFLTFLEHETGNSKELLHEYFKNLFLKRQEVIKTKDGEKLIDVIGSTTRLSKKEFTEYFDKCINYAIDNNIDVSLFFELRGDL